MVDFSKLVKSKIEQAKIDWRTQGQDSLNMPKSNFELDKIAETGIVPSIDTNDPNLEGRN